MTSLSKNKVAKKRGRPVGSKNKTAAKIKSFKRRGRPRLDSLPSEFSSWEDAYRSTLNNLQIAYKCIVELSDVKQSYIRTQEDLTGLATIINYLELKLEEKYRKDYECTSIRSSEDCA